METDLACLTTGSRRPSTAAQVFTGYVGNADHSRRPEKMIGEYCPGDAMIWAAFFKGPVYRTLRPFDYRQ
jgi:hypothetical protein